MERTFADIPPGEVLWITGLSAAGKTTLAGMTVAEVRHRGGNVTFVDGDTIRELMGNDLDHTESDRLTNAYRIARLCRFLSGQGHHVVCSTMSLFDEIHQWNRQNIARYVEVFLKVPIETLQARDTKGIYYAEPASGKPRTVGVDLQFNPPRNPDIVHDNTGSLEDLRRFAIQLAERIGPHRPIMHKPREHNRCQPS